MLIWVLHLPQSDGSIITKPFANFDDITLYLKQAKGATSISTNGPIHPKVGDYRYFEFDNDSGYAILGQVRFS